MGEGEDAKSLATVEELSRGFAQWGLLRGDLVVAVGGGVVGDTAGFAAAVYYRGVDVVQVPTTLLAMVDSAIGGKTGVNLPEGKNLVGAFHQPRAVFVNPVVLQTLPDREYRCGLGEVAKYALMGDDFVSARVDALVARDPEVLAEVIARCVEIKAASSPPTSTSVPACGRCSTTATPSRTRWRPRPATRCCTAKRSRSVSCSPRNSARCSNGCRPERSANRSARRRARAADVRPPGLRADDLLAIMARDKKSAGGLTFVLDGPNGIERVDDPDPGCGAQGVGGDSSGGLMAKILLLSGPNLNLLGEREPEHYGTTTLAELVALASETAAKLGHDVEHVQSNHEGAIIDAIHGAAGARRS